MAGLDVRGYTIYQHQHKAIQLSLNDRNVCMTTATASGKSLVFYISGLERLYRRPHGTVLAVYPLKALTDQQEMKWREAMAQRMKLRINSSPVSTAVSRQSNLPLSCGAGWVSYPLDASLGFYFDQPRFERNYFSSMPSSIRPKAWCTGANAYHRRALALKMSR